MQIWKQILLVELFRKVTAFCQENPYISLWRLTLSEDRLSDFVRFQ